MDDCRVSAVALRPARSGCRDRGHAETTYLCPRSHRGTGLSPLIVTLGLYAVGCGVTASLGDDGSTRGGIDGSGAGSNAPGVDGGANGTGGQGTGGSSGTPTGGGGGRTGPATGGRIGGIGSGGAAGNGRGTGGASTGSGGAGATGVGGNGGGGTSGGAAGLEAVITEALFNQMFPNRNQFYTCAGLVMAARSFPAFATTGDLATRQREAAAFLANAAHETGGLAFIEQINKTAACSPQASCACAPGKLYYGRGPLQLTWNYNYCAAGRALGLPLGTDPDLVARDANVAYQTALWFWMTQSGAGSMTAHDAMMNGSGFGETIRTINGGLECNGGNPGQVQSRINFYMRFTQLLGVTAGNNVGC
jgi:predicted chitinase